MEDYAELLKDPRWQKKKTEILELDDFTCRWCGCKYRPLHVHHVEYYKDHLPWEYEDDNLVTLCEVCHKRVHDGEIATCELQFVVSNARVTHVPKTSPFYGYPYADEEDVSCETVTVFRSLKMQLISFVNRNREWLEDVDGVNVGVLIGSNLRFIKFIGSITRPQMVLEYAVIDCAYHFGDILKPVKDKITNLFFKESGASLFFAPILNCFPGDIYDGITDGWSGYVSRVINSEPYPWEHMEGVKIIDF